MKFFKVYLAAFLVPVVLYALVTNSWVPPATDSSQPQFQASPMSAKEVRSPNISHLSGHPVSQDSHKQQVKPASPKDYRNFTPHSTTISHGRTGQPPNGNSSGDNHRKASSHPVLPPDVISRIKKFLFFLGNGRCGSSIIGALLDAHPHVVVAHESLFIKKVGEYIGSKQKLLNELYAKSGAKRREKSKLQGWSLKLDSSWQGSYDKYIDVIGDKDGGNLAKVYSVDKEKFKENYALLMATLDIPRRVIHSIRNPFDTIATRALVGWKLPRGYATIKRKNETLKVSAEGLQKYIDNEFRLYTEAEELISLHGRENILDVHNCDLVADPKATLLKIFDFLGVEATEDYLDTCARIVFKSVSKSRNRLEWTPQQIEMVEKRMKNHDMLSRYSFTSE